jgi:hypothetical protein
LTQKGLKFLKSFPDSIQSWPVAHSFIVECLDWLEIVVYARERGILIYKTKRYLPNWPQMKKVLGFLYHALYETWPKWIGNGKLRKLRERECRLREAALKATFSDKRERSGWQ